MTIFDIIAIQSIKFAIIIDEKFTAAKDKVFSIYRHFRNN